MNPVSWICNAVGNLCTSIEHGIQIAQLTRRFGRKVSVQNLDHQSSRHRAIKKSLPIQ